MMRRGGEGFCLRGERGGGLRVCLFRCPWGYFFLAALLRFLYVAKSFDLGILLLAIYVGARVSRSLLTNAIC